MRLITQIFIYVAFLTPTCLWAQTNSLQDFAKELVLDTDHATIYVAKEYLTMDPRMPRAKAVAIKKGKFLAVGSFDEVKSAAGAGAVVDTSLASKVVTAGFVEQHVHPVLAALTMSTKVISIEDWDAIDGFSPAVRDPEAYQKRLFAALEEHREGPTKDQPFITWGYHHYMHGVLSRELLNKLAPDFPVIVWHRSCHEFFLNDLALQRAGIDRSFFEKMPQGAKDQSNWNNGQVDKDFPPSATAANGLLRCGIKCLSDSAVVLS